jgi:lipopolysaccharide transport system permease protein
VNSQNELRAIVVRPSRGLLDVALSEVLRSRELLYFLVWRDLKVRYSQALLGVAWALLQPVVAVTIFTIIFGYFAKLPSDGQPYVLFAYSAVLLWTLFSESMRRCSLGLVGDSNLVKKVYFPRLIIPIANVLTPLIDFFITLVVVVPLLVIFGVPPSLKMLFIPVFALLTIAFALGVGLWLAPLNVKYRDISHTLPFLLQIWMYASPVVYPLSMIPEKWATLYSLNPMVGIIEGFRWAILSDYSFNPSSLLISLIIVPLLLISGVIWFRQCERQFADIL